MAVSLTRAQYSELFLELKQATSPGEQGRPTKALRVPRTIRRTVDHKKNNEKGVSQDGEMAAALGAAASRTEDSWSKGEAVADEGSTPAGRAPLFRSLLPIYRLGVPPLPKTPIRTSRVIQRRMRSDGAIRMG